MAAPPPPMPGIGGFGPPPPPPLPGGNSGASILPAKQPPTLANERVRKNLLWLAIAHLEAKLRSPLNER